MKTYVRVAVCGGVLSVATAANAWVPWSNSNGAGDFFTWANGGSANGLYGDPVLVNGNTLVFFPQHFRAEATDGGSQSTWDTLEVDLFAMQGFEFTGVVVTEFGQYGVTNTGSAAAYGEIEAFELNTLESAFEPLITTPGFPVYAGTDSWDGLINLDLGALPTKWESVHITLSNTLTVETDIGGVAYIQKDVIGGAVALTFIPAPASVGLLGLGALLGYRRRR